MTMDVISELSKTLSMSSGVVKGCSNLSHGRGMCRRTKKTSMAALLTSHRKQLPPEQPFHNSCWSNGKRSSFHTDNGAPILHYSRSNILRLCQTRASLSRSLRCFMRYELLSIFPKIMYERFEKKERSQDN